MLCKTVVYVDWNLQQKRGENGLAFYSFTTHFCPPPQKSCELHVFLQLAAHNSFGKFHVCRAISYFGWWWKSSICLFVVVIIASHLRGDCMGRDLWSHFCGKYKSRITSSQSPIRASWKTRKLFLELACLKLFLGQICSQLNGQASHKTEVYFHENRTLNYAYTCK